MTEFTEAGYTFHNAADEGVSFRYPSGSHIHPFTRVDGSGRFKTLARDIRNRI